MQATQAASAFRLPDGAGESTLLLVLTGYQLPDGGSLSLAARPLEQGRIKSFASVR
ncbi:hypothetical protein [Cedecea colo]|uniref:hypothetical protein n=1 Tax=Cedecea colo TaxID=2552946 RepID=UPI0014302177